MHTDWSYHTVMDIVYFCTTQVQVCSLILPVVDLFERVWIVCHKHGVSHMYSIYHVSSQSYNRAQWEKTAWRKQCISLELET